MLNHIAGVGHKIKHAYNYVVNYEVYLVDCQLSGLQDSKAKLRSSAKLAADLQDSSNNELSWKTYQKDIYKELQKNILHLLSTKNYLINERI
ncbi:hypothetical protein SE924_15185 [Legionella pneumophila]|nr:hypothetical protein [Legionella pneumophila]